MWGGSAGAEATGVTSTPTTAKVNFTAQAAGAFLTAPQFGVEVSSDLAESYGYTDQVTDGVSALDVLVKAHKLIFGDAFTKDDAKTYLEVGTYVKTIFGEETSANGFILNGMYPHDGTKSEWGGYNGTTVVTQKIVTGDSVDFFIYQDGTSWSDQNVWFEKGGASIDEVSAYKDRPFELQIKGVSYMSGYQYVDKAAMVAAGAGIESAQLALVNPESGELTNIENAVTDKNGNVSFKLSTAGENLIAAYMPETDIKDGKAPLIMRLIKVNVVEPNASISVPSDATVKVIYKGYSGYNFRRGEATDYLYFTEDNNVKTYFFNLSGKTGGNLYYYYRISGENYVTNVGMINPKENLTITKETLKPDGKNKHDIDRNVKNNSGYNVADIYININEKNYLRLNGVGDTYQLVPLRNWEAIEDFSNNFFVEPDYSYTVLNENGEEDNSVVSVSKDGIVTAKAKGTAIVLVSYDAMYNHYNGWSKGFLGAIWPENTGVFVVSVGADASGIETGMIINEGKNTVDSKLSGDAIDAEHDVIYYAGSEGEYKFTPETEGVAVSVANPIVTDKLTYTGYKAVQEKNGSFAVPLAEGRNIVKLEKDGKTEYQVITAKKVRYTINNGDPVKAGDAISIKFEELFGPVGKLAGVYNPNTAIVYEKNTGYEEKLFGSKPSQYNFASNAESQTVSNEVTKNEAVQWGRKVVAIKIGETLKIPTNYDKDVFTLSEGSFFTYMYGDPAGNHRGITYENGKAPNLNANQRVIYAGQLPDIEIPIVATTAELSKISLTTTDVKTTYYEGDAFDTTNLVVTAEYTDGVTQTATNYEVSPSVLTKDTEKVTITYRGKTATIPVRVKEIQLTGIEIETQPAKTTYTVGDVFNPNGIKIKATYNNNSTADVTSKVTYSNTVFNTAGDAIAVKVTYTEKGITKETTLNVKVNPAQGGTTPSDTISVTFTLLGDSHHGEPTKATGTHTLKANNLETWIRKTTYTLPKGSNVVYLLEKALGTAGIPYTNPSGNYVDTIRGLAAFDNGTNSGWMYTYNGKHGLLGVAEQKLNDGDAIVFHYTDDYTKEEGSEQWNGGSGGTVEEVKSVTSDTKAGTTTAPTEVKVGEKTNADGTKTKVADVKVSADNQKEILKQAKANKSKEIILNVSKSAVGDAAKADVTLDKSFIDFIVKDTNAKLTIKTPFGDKTYTQDELKAMSAAATGSTISIAVEKAAEEPADDAAAKVEKAKSIVKDMKLTARSSKTAKKNVKAVLKNDAKTKAAIKELKDLGFTVKYRFYRSTKKSASYKSAITKKVASYTNTSGKKGTKYFYKVQVRVYDENGKLVAKTALKQCKYASRTWTK